MPGDYRVWPISATSWGWQVTVHPGVYTTGTATDLATARQAARNAGGKKLQP